MRSRMTSSASAARLGWSRAQSCVRTARSVSSRRSRLRSAAACSCRPAATASCFSIVTCVICSSRSPTSGPLPRRSSMADRRASMASIRAASATACRSRRRALGRRCGRCGCRGFCGFRGHCLLGFLGPRLIRGQQVDHLLADPVQVRAQPDQDLGGHAVALADQAEQDVLGADVVVVQLERLAQRQLQHLLGPRRERNVPRRRLLALADDFLDLTTDHVQADAQRLQRFGRGALALVDEAEQEVLGADVVVVEHPGLLLGQDHNPPRPVGKPLEHRLLRSRAR